MDFATATPPDAADLGAMARAAIEALPDAYRRAAQEVVLQVVDFAPEEILRSTGCQDPFQLTGLYEGIPLTQKSVLDQPIGQDMIWLFRRPILEEWCNRGDVPLANLVSHVFIHELAHHFGWSDAEIAEIDRWWE